jgi:hypothetical protein
MKTEMDLLEKSLSLESVSEGDTNDFLEKNKVVLSLAPLKNAAIDETASARKAFVTRDIASSAEKFFKPILPPQGSILQNQMELSDQHDLQNHLMVEEILSQVQVDSDSVLSEISQTHFIEEVLDRKSDSDTVKKVRDQSSDNEENPQDTIEKEKSLQAASFNKE